MAPELAPANEASNDVSSDRAAPSDALDNPDSLNFWEPEEDQVKPEFQNKGTETDREPAEVQPNQEAEKTDQEQPDPDKPDDEAKAEEAPAEPEDSVVIAMPGGEKLELKELKSGYMRDRDYRHKTTEIANTRRNLEALSARVTESANAISEVLMSQVPKAPDQSLSLTDPLRYIQEKAQHEAALEFVNSIVEKATTAKSVGNTLTQEQQAEISRVEAAKLAEAFPAIRTADGQKQFFDGALGVARELGFADTELSTVTDHRIFKVLHYAKLGRDAEAAKAKAAGKVANVPPVAAQRRQAGPNAAKARANQEALSKLNRSGSMRDAMQVDFD